jgi:hypothetical protein
VVPYTAGWNLVAGFPGLGGAITVLPGVTGSLYTFQTGDTAYQVFPISTPLEPGRGYWAYFATPTSVVLPQMGPALQPFSQPLPAGQFVMIGNPFPTTATVSGADVVYVYDQRNGYQQTTTLQTGQGAWAYSAAGGTVTFAPPGAVAARR